MILGGANVSAHFSYVYRNESPSVWVPSTERRKLILFTRNKKSDRNNIRILLIHIIQMLLVNPRQLNHQVKWNELQLEGWTLSENELPE